MLNGEATNTNFIVFGLTYRTRGEHANHYTTDAVVISYYSPFDQPKTELKNLLKINSSTY